MRFGGLFAFFAAADVSCAVFGAATTLLLPCGVPVKATRREPRVLRQRAAHLVHARAARRSGPRRWLLDHVDLAEQRVARRFGAVRVP